MQLPKATLEMWMREFYFDTRMDLGSSGVETYTLGELREMFDITDEELNNVKFDDSLTCGCDGLRQAIADRWGNGDLNTVMTSNGSNEMLFHIMSTMLNPDDEVIILDPIYHALSTVAETKKCHIKRWELKPENNFQPQMEDFRKLISPKTKMIAVNFPHNPTGITISREEQIELLKLAKEADAYLVWDAAFEEMPIEGERLPNPFLEYDKAISVGTLSKGYGLPGLRIGWCFASPEIIESCVQLRDYTTLYVSPLVEVVGQRAIENAGQLLKPRMDDSLTNYKVLKEWVESNSDKIEWSNPKGGVCCLIKFKNVEDTEAFCRAFATKHEVLLVPGECFGQKGYIRLGYGASVKEFNEGLGLLQDFLHAEYW